MGTWRGPGPVVFKRKKKKRKGPSLWSSAGGVSWFPGLQGAEGAEREAQLDEVRSALCCDESPTSSLTVVHLCDPLPGMVSCSSASAGVKGGKMGKSHEKSRNGGVRGTSSCSPHGSGSHEESRTRRVRSGSFLDNTLVCPLRQVTACWSQGLCSCRPGRLRGLACVRGSQGGHRVRRCQATSSRYC